MGDAQRKAKKQSVEHWQEIFRSGNNMAIPVPEVFQQSDQVIDMIRDQIQPIENRFDFDKITDTSARIENCSNKGNASY